MNLDHIKAHLIASDPTLSEVVANSTFEMHYSTDADVYTVLLDGIVSQQLSVKAAATIFKRFLGIFPDEYPHPHLILELTDEEMRAVGLSRQKLSYIRNVAQYWVDNNLQKTDWHARTDSDIMALLTPIKGVGRWTVEMLLMFSLYRPDVFAPDDLGIQQAMIRRYGLEEKGAKLRRQMEEIAEAWRPYRTYACRFLWHWKDKKP